MKKNYFIILLFILLSCAYEEPFSKYDGKNLIARLDLTTDWLIDSGVLIDATTESPPAGYQTSYYFYFINLLDSKSSNFETSTGINDTGNWTSSPDSGSSSVADKLEVRANPSSKLEGTKSLYIKLTNNPYPQYVYYEFTPEAFTNYTFKFDYYNSASSSIGLSFGLSSNNEDNQIYISSTASEEKGSFVAHFSAISNSPSQIRFGFKENKNWESGIELYIDKIALFKASNHSISKLINIVESNDRTNDKTGEEFPEGVYRFEIYAKKDTSDILTLKLGGAVKSFSLTDSWKKYTLQAQILRTEGFLKLEILPTSTNDNDKFPGGIFITKPELYLLYNQATP